MIFLLCAYRNRSIYLLEVKIGLNKDTECDRKCTKWQCQSKFIYDNRGGKTLSIYLYIYFWKYVQVC